MANQRSGLKIDRAKVKGQAEVESRKQGKIYKRWKKECRSDRMWVGSEQVETLGGRIGKQAEMGEKEKWKASKGGCKTRVRWNACLDTCKIKSLPKFVQHYYFDTDDART